MRFAGFHVLVTSLAVAGCAGRGHPARSAVTVRPTGPVIAGIWDGLVHETLTAGMGAGDTRVEKQEWHLEQTGTAVRGYYLASSTFTSGDGRPYVCSRQPTFSALVRFDVEGQVRDGAVVLAETTQSAAEGRCNPGQRQLAQYTAEIRGDVLTLVVQGQHQVQRRILYRNRGTPEVAALVAAATAARNEEPRLPLLGTAPFSPGVALAPGGPSSSSSLSSPSSPSSVAPTTAPPPVDVSGVWIWEHRGAIPTGDEKQEREEWHVDQDGARLSGYYDRVVREISTDGHAFKCSMDTVFEIATRYKFRGEVRGNQLVIYESSYEVLEPSACDNGQRRLDAYEGMANGDEVRLIWGVGGQVLRRPRPDVPTQRF